MKQIIEKERLVIFICKNIEETGEIMVKTKTKRIHFNKESKLTKNQKQKISGQIMGKIKVNKTVGIIQRAKEYFIEKGMTYTQKLIAEHTGLGIATIKRHWSKEVTNEEIKFNTEEIIDNLEIISEEEFFSKPEMKMEKSQFLKLLYTL